MTLESVSRTPRRFRLLSEARLASEGHIERRPGDRSTAGCGCPHSWLEVDHLSGANLRWHFEREVDLSGFNPAHVSASVSDPRKAERPTSRGSSATNPWDPRLLVLHGANR